MTLIIDTITSILTNATIITISIILVPTMTITLASIPIPEVSKKYTVLK